MFWFAWHAKWIELCDSISSLTRLTVAAAPSKLRDVLLSFPIAFAISFISFVVPGIGARPGVFGWLMISSLDHETFCAEEILFFSRSALTVGVYEDTPKDKIHDPGESGLFSAYIPAA